MRGRHRHKRGHYRGLGLIGLTLIAAASIIIVSVTVARDTSPKSPDVAAFKWAVPSLPSKTIILQDEPHGAPASDCSVLPPQERGEAGREGSLNTSHPPVPAPATGFTDDLSQAAHSYMAQNAINLQWAADRQSLIARITAYMKGVPAAYLIPLMVDLGHDYGIDPRLCAVTCIEESSGRGNLFGALGCSIGGCDYETQVRWYFDQVTRNGYMDVWHIAWMWHGGGSAGADHSSYADNVTRQVEAI